MRTAFDFITVQTIANYTVFEYISIAKQNKKKLSFAKVGQHLIVHIVDFVSETVSANVVLLICVFSGSFIHFHVCLLYT